MTLFDVDTSGYLRAHASGGRRIHQVCEKCAKAFTGDYRVCPEDGGRLLRVSVEEDRAGQTVDGKFTFLDLLGKGGMGSVYRALQHSMEREVAVKVLDKNFARDVGAVRRFLQEAKGASKLNHPNIITLFDFGQSENGDLYLMMELLNGLPLTDVIVAEAPLAPSRAVAMTLQICNALHYAHEQGVVHRDLKPDNCFVLHQGQGDFVKVLDFGIAKMQAVDGAESITNTGVVCGTPAYMSPEQAQGKSVDRRSDVYSIGVLLYEMLAGVRPFTGETPVQLLLAHLNEEPVPLREARAGVQIPSEIEQVVMRSLAKEPDRRPQTAREMAHELRIALRNHSVRPSTVELAAIDTSRGVAMPPPPRRIQQTEPQPGFATDETAIRQTPFPLMDVPAPEPAVADGETVEEDLTGPRPRWIPLAAVAVLVVAVGGWAMFGSETPPAPDKAVAQATPAPVVSDEAASSGSAEDGTTARLAPGAQKPPASAAAHTAQKPLVEAPVPAAPGGAVPAASARPSPRRVPDAESARRRAEAGEASPALLEPKPAEPKPAEPKPAEPKPVEPKPAEPKPAEPRPAGATAQPAEAKPAPPGKPGPTPAQPTGAEAAVPSAQASAPGAKPTAPVAATFRVETKPAGATVWLGSQKLGKSPVDVPRGEGTYRLSARKSGYKSASRTVPGDHEGTVKIKLNRKRSASPTFAR